MELLLDSLRKVITVRCAGLFAGSRSKMIVIGYSC